MKKLLIAFLFISFLLCICNCEGDPSYLSLEKQNQINSSGIYHKPPTVYQANILTNISRDNRLSGEIYGSGSINGVSIIGTGVGSGKMEIKGKLQTNREISFYVQDEGDSIIKNIVLPINQCKIIATTGIPTYTCTTKISYKKHAEMYGVTLKYFTKKIYIVKLPIEIIQQLQ